MMDEYSAPDYRHAALLTIDVQHSTLEGGSLEIPGTRDAASGIKDVASLFGENSWPIVRVVRLYEPDGSNAELCSRRALEQRAEPFLVGTTGSALAEELMPKTGWSWTIARYWPAVFSRSVRSNGSCTSRDGAPSVALAFEGYRDQSRSSGLFSTVCLAVSLHRDELNARRNNG
jgi:hypothetical protein